MQGANHECTIPCFVKILEVGLLLRLYWQDAKHASVGDVAQRIERSLQNERTGAGSNPATPTKVVTTYGFIEL